MSVANVNWLWVGAGVMAICFAIFAYCLSRGRWSRSGVLVGLANLFVAALHSVAPIRGWADPQYAGFSNGFFRAEQGPLVTLVAGSILVAALASSCVAVLNRVGRPMLVIAITDGVLALNFAAVLVAGLVTDPSQMRIRLGEYLTIPALPTVLLLLVLFTLPLGASAVWAGRRVSSR